MKVTITQRIHPALLEPAAPNTMRLYAEPATGAPGYVLYDLDGERYLLSKSRRPVRYDDLLEARAAATDVARAARSNLVFALPDGVDMPEAEDQS